MFKLKSLKFILFVSVITSSSSFLSKFVHAQVPTSITVSPAIVEFNIKPGQIEHKTITVTNPSVNPLGIGITLNQVTPAEAQGLAIELKKPDWIQLSDASILLNSKQSREVELVISPHKTTPAGGYYAMVYFQAALPVSQVSIGATTSIPRIGALLLINVEGKGTRKYEIIRQPKYARFLAKSYPSVTFAIKNTGDTHIVPNGNLEFNRVGPNQHYSQGFAPTLILPSTIREVIVPKVEELAPGLYKLSAKFPLYNTSNSNYYQTYPAGYIVIYGNYSKFLYLVPLGCSVIIGLLILKKRKNLKRALKVLLLPKSHL